MEKLVESLLFEFDCVILPGFGGFVAQKTNASIHPSGKFAYPASKTIAFNKNLNQIQKQNHKSKLPQLNISNQKQTQIHQWRIGCSCDKNRHNCSRRANNS